MEVAYWGVIARAVHVVTVVAWIGGVFFVTTVLLPALKQRPESDWLNEFQVIERRSLLPKDERRLHAREPRDPRDTCQPRRGPANPVAAGRVVAA